MADTGWGTKAAIELIIFIGITYTAEFLVTGTSALNSWPTTAPNSVGATTPILNIFVSGINFFWGVISIFFNLFTFNIPGMPIEIRMILTPLYSGMIIFCCIIFWSKIVFIFKTVINGFILIYNFTGGLFFGKMDYLQTSD